MTPADLIANVLHHVEDEGLNDEQSTALAHDILHALAGAGLVVAHVDLLADIDKAFTNLGVCADPGCMKPVCGWVPPALVRRLRAALAEGVITDGQ